MLNWLISLFHKLFNKLFLTSSAPTTYNGENNIKKKALCIGINDYPGTGNDLNGCINDANEWSNILQFTYGFNIKKLLNAQATKYEVKKEIVNLFNNANQEDVLVITYSGHGSSVIDKNNDEIDGKDETWYLYDGNFIDDEIKALIDTLKDGVKLIVISDSCHSGTVTRDMLCSMVENHLPRYMPPKSNEDVIELSSLPFLNRVLSRNTAKDILISGCKSDEYSYDANFNGINMGAFSYTALNILKKTPKITYKNFYDEIRKNLPNNNYPQTPQLDCPQHYLNDNIFE